MTLFDDCLMTVPASRRPGPSKYKRRASSGAITTVSSLLTSISRTSRAEIRRQIGAGRGEKLPEGMTDCGKYCEVCLEKAKLCCQSHLSYESGVTTIKNVIWQTQAVALMEHSHV